MKLLELYSLATGLKIKDQFLLSKLYPLPFQKYITIHTSSGQPAKNFSYWHEVIALIKDKLEENDIKIVQVGQGDIPLPHCHNLLDKTDIHQTNHIITECLLHISGDSWMPHRLGHINHPILEIFGSTDKRNHSPYQFNEKDTVFLESHRLGRNTSFQAQEFPKTIDFITPESVANNIFKLLKIDHQINRESLYIGMFYSEIRIEIIPSCILQGNYPLAQPPVIRMDYEFHPGLLEENLKIRKCIIITNKEIDAKILSAHKQNIALLRIEIDKVSLEWIKEIKKVGIPINYYTLEKDETKVQAKRLELFGICQFDQINYPTKDQCKEAVDVYLNKKTEIDIGKVKFKTNKFIFARDKFYLSKQHYDQNIAAKSFDDNIGDVIDTDQFWMDQAHFYLFR